MKFPAFFAGLVFLLTSQIAFCQTPASSPPPVSPTKVGSDPKDHSKQAVVVEKWSYVLSFENDGTGTRENTSRIRVQSEAGVRALGVLRFPYSSASEAVSIAY